MSDPVIVALIAVVGTVANSALTLYSNRKRNEQHAETAASIETVHRDVNGKMAQLLEVTAKAAKAKGKLEEQTEQKAREEFKD